MENKSAEKRKKPGRLGLIMMSICLLILTGGTIASLMFSNVITQYFSKPNFDEAKVAKSKEPALSVVEKIADEGIVMLRNEGQTLPLASKETKVNLFGWSSISPMISGGIGSGSGNTRNTLDYVTALKEQGFEPNQELLDFYEGLDYSRDVKNSFGKFDVDYRKTEAPMNEYSDELWQKARDYSDVAIVMFSRLGNEADDLPTSMADLDGKADEHYLELGEKEAALLDKIKGLDFKKTIVIINAGFPFETGFAEEKGVDALLWAGGPGQTGMKSLVRIIKGEVSPSGRLPDTFAYDLTSSPAYQNFGNYRYDTEPYKAEGYDGEEERYYNYVDYVEGIYVGYRYYETRFVDNKTKVVDEERYQKEVQFPFGYGLSYTQFKQEIIGFNQGDKTGEMTVKVTNTGGVAGKEVAQLYVTAPYTEGGIEKSHVSLLGFAKTEQLEPGESAELTIDFTIEALASFDYRTANSYVLDAGTYDIKLMANSHEVIDQREVKIDKQVVYGEDNKRESDQVPAVAQFKDIESDLTYLSRSDWEGTFPKDVPEIKAVSDEVLAKLQDTDVNSAYIDADAKDIVIKDNGLELKDLEGLDYNDPKWEKLLEQLSVNDMKKLIGLGGYATQAVASVKKPYTTDLDGPTGIFALVNDHSYDGVLYPTAVVIASTWNTELAKEMGEVYGDEAVAWGVSGIYGPSMNIHRTPFGGRNYEYYSEDGYLSGQMAAGVVSGLGEKDVYSYIKHFALYDQTANAFGLSTWSNEQAVREIYLKPFELVVKEGNARAVMSSYNRIGTTWSGAKKELLTNVLREEWGFTGMVITDWFTKPMDANQAIFAGNDLMLATTHGNGNDPSDVSNAGKQAMRQASHNILYTVGNSVAMEYNDFGPKPYWLYGLIAVDIAAVAGALLYIVKRKKKLKES